jgi:NAD(P)-dependent dehydrogenase (short-subunit alcohol dehydrogenase family)
MKIAMIGRGIIGSAVADLLSAEHDVIRASRSGGDIQLDALSVESITAFYQKLGKFDAMIMAIGGGRIYVPFWELDPQDYLGRVMSQINLVRLGMPYINDGGAFILSSGLMSKAPLPGFTAISSSNGAIEKFVLGAAQDMPRGVRINCVSATNVKETFETYFPDVDLSNTTVQPVAQVAEAYRFALFSAESGNDFDTRDYDHDRA